MRHPSRILWLAGAAIVLGLAAPSALSAQPLDSLTAGTRVRVSSWAQRRVTGTIVRADSTGLVLVPEGSIQPFSLRLDELTGIDVSRGRRTPGEAFAQGAWKGFLVGAAVGVVATGLALRSDLSGSCDGCMASLIVGELSVMFTGATTAVGGLVGLAGRERWRKVWPPWQTRRR